MNVHTGSHLRCVNVPKIGTLTENTVYTVRDVRARGPIDGHEAQVRVRLNDQGNKWFLVGNFECLDDDTSKQIAELQAMLTAGAAKLAELTGKSV